MRVKPFASRIFISDSLETLLLVKVRAHLMWAPAVPYMSNRGAKPQPTATASNNLFFYIYLDAWPAFMVWSERPANDN